MKLESDKVAVVEAVLLQNGAHSVTLMDAGDSPVLEPAPGETPLWPDITISALFDPEVNEAQLKTTLGNSLGLDLPPRYRFESLPDRCWEREWLKDFSAMKFGQHLWVVPHGDVAPDDKAAAIVRLDPGLAFGTGTHATTALCLAWLDEINLTEKSVLDYGCGSGILGIAACKLGADYVVGFDIDEQAITASLQNASRNQVSNQFSASLTLPRKSGGFDVVVANILAGTLIEHAETIPEKLKPGGMLALSGILAEQCTSVQTAYCENIEFEAVRMMDDWALLTGEKRLRC